MNVFLPGVIKWADVVFTVIPVGLPVRVTVALGKTPGTTVEGGGVFPNWRETVPSTGEPQRVAFGVIMPVVADTYHVYVALQVAGEIVMFYQATEDVIIAGAEVISLVWQ